MNAAQIHLLINHLPVLLPVVGAALIVSGLGAKSQDLRDAGAWIIVLSALCVIPTYLSGEPTENILKNYPGASRLLIEDHEGSALGTLVALEVAGVLGLLLIYGSRTGRGWARAAVVSGWGLLLLFSLVSFGFAARTAHLGGLIRHEEIRTSDRF